MSFSTPAVVALLLTLLACLMQCPDCTQVDTMVAQSLDLPPSAARWRQHQRKQNDKQAARRASGHFSVAAIPWAAPSKPAGPGVPEAASVEDIVGAAQVSSCARQQLVTAHHTGRPLQPARLLPGAVAAAQTAAAGWRRNANCGLELDSL